LPASAVKDGGLIFINTGVAARRYGAAKVLKDPSACAAPKRLALGGTVEIGRQVRAGPR
jgi:hypothetical protein